ncbi:ER membrane protein complex subunit-like protein [Seiridium cupressi]
MRFSLPALLSALPACLAAAAAATASAKTSLVLSIPASQFLPNPNVLPASTHATLTTLHQSYSAPLSVANTFVFHNVTPGSYLADVHCASYGFAPLRIDVDAAEDGAAGADVRSSVRAWETFRGNEWGNKGEESVRQDGAGGAVFAVKCLGKKVFFQERGSCKFSFAFHPCVADNAKSKLLVAGFADECMTVSVLTILKNPMILLGLISMGIFFGMPKLVENSEYSSAPPYKIPETMILMQPTVDPEMRAEWEEQQKKNPMNSIMGGGQAGANPMGNFDMASFLAGSGDNKGEANSGSGGKKGGKR